MPAQLPAGPPATAPHRRVLLIDGLAGIAVVWVLWVAAQVPHLAGRAPWMMHGGAFGPAQHPAMHGFTPVWGVLPFALGCGVGVALRRRTPRVGYGLVVAGAAGYLALQAPVPPALLGPVLVVYALAGRLPLRRWPAYAAALLALPVAALARRPAFGLADPGTYGGLLLGALVLAVSALIALLQRNRREAARAQRDEELARVASAERLRVAREVHDIVGHSLSVISMQAGVALHVLDARPQQAKISLEAIRQSSRDALAELRHALGVFRDETGDGLRTPAPDLARIDDLAAALRVAGRSISVQRDIPTGTAIPAAVQQTAFRIVQEALTNVVRHTDRAAAAVGLSIDQARVVIEVADDGPVLPGPIVEGNGIHGMRERAASVGGTVDIRAGSQGGVTVRATLPLPDRGEEPECVSQEEHR